MKTIILTILILVVSLHVNSQKLKSIYGYVKNEAGNPVEGVKVASQEKFSKIFTNPGGWFFLNVPEGDTIMYFIHENYVTKILAHSGLHRYDVELKSKNASRDIIMKAGKKNLLMQIPEFSMNKSAALHVTGVFAPGPTYPNETESYSTIHENVFRNVLSAPLSTFSVDIDNASYSNVRRYVNQGEMPPVDAVRIEEMINYFRYDYPAPTGENTFSLYTELSVCPWSLQHYLLHIGLKGKEIEKSKLPPSNLVFLLDVSGSMSAPNKLPLVKRAFAMLVNELRPNDRIALVVYAGAAGKVLDSTPGNKKEEILNALEKLEAGGSTAGSEGLKLAYQIANDNFIKNGNNRIVMATDGDFNVGISSNSEMERLVEKERKNGIFMTVLGFGMGNLKDDKMEIIADKGNGNYAYIDNIQEARKVFISEFGGTLFTIAKDVKFQVEFNPKKVKSYRLVGYENRLLNAEDFSNDSKDAGEIGSGHTVTALYEIIAADSKEEIPSIDPLKYQTVNPVEGKSAKEWLTIKIRYKEPESNASKLVEQPVESATKELSGTSDNFRFSASVAGFGMLLRGSEYMGDNTFGKILDLASKSKGSDTEGHRTEFIQLVKTVKDLHFFD